MCFPMRVKSSHKHAESLAPLVLPNFSTFEPINTGTNKGTTVHSLKVVYMPEAITVDREIPRQKFLPVKLSCHFIFVAMTTPQRNGIGQNFTYCT